jgi:hypothetical protein
MSRMIIIVFIKDALAATRSPSGRRENNTGFLRTTLTRWQMIRAEKKKKSQKTRPSRRVERHPR